MINYIYESITCIDTVCILYLINHGAFCDPINKYGLTHLIEHLYFTKHNEYHSSIQKINNIGGEINAFTSYEYMGFYIKVPSNECKLAIKILGEIINRTLNDLSNNLEQERKIVITELQTRQDIPQLEIMHILYQQMFPNTRLSELVGGTMPNILNINREDILNFKCNLSPYVISIVGNANMSKSKLESLLNKYFKPKKINKKFKSEYVEMHHGLNRRIVYLNRGLKSLNICFGIKILDSIDSIEKYNAMEILSLYLTNGMKSILMHKLREQYRLIYTVKSAWIYYSELQLGEFHIWCTTLQPEYVNKCIDEIWNTLNGLILTKKEYENIKIVHKNKYKMMKEDIKALAIDKAIKHLILDIGDDNKYMKLKEFNKFLKQILQINNIYITIMN